MVHELRILSFFLCVLCTNLVGAQSGKAQSAQELYGEVMNLRSRGQYETAAKVCRQYIARLESDSLARPYEIEDARRLLKTIDFLRSLPDSLRERMAYADRNAQRIDSLYAVDQLDSALTVQNEILEIQRQILGNEHEDVATSMDNLAVILEESSRGELGEIERLYRESLRMRREILGEYNRAYTASLNNLATFLETKRGDYAAAEALYVRAVAIDRKILDHDDLDLAVDLNNLGDLRRSLGNYLNAAPMLKEALDIRAGRLGGGHPLVCQSRNNLGFLHYDMGQYSEAESLYLEVIATCNSKDAARVVVSTVGNLGTLYWRQGNYSRAESQYRENVDLKLGLFAKGAPELSVSYFNLANCLYPQGRYVEAETHYKMALEIDKRYLSADHPWIARDLAYMGRVLLVQGRLEEAESILVDATRIFEAARRRVSFEGLARGFFTSVHSPYSWLAVAQIEQGKMLEGWASAEKDRGRLMLDLLATRHLRELTPSESERERQLESNLMACEARQTLAHSGTTSGAELEELDQDVARAMDEWLSYQQRLSDKYPVTEGAAFPLEKVQAALEKGSGIVGWLSVEGENYVYLVPFAGCVRWAKLASTEIESVAVAFRFAASRRSSKLEHCQELARKVYGVALKPLEAHLDGLSRLYIIPSGPMVGIPVEALMIDGNTFTSDRWLISYTSSSTVLAWLAERQEPHSPLAFLGVGDPVFASEDTTDGSRKPRRYLNRLEWTAGEVEEIATYFPSSTVLTREDASEKRLVALAKNNELRAYRYIHFATHAIPDNVFGTRSSLFLTQVGLPDPAESVINKQRIIDDRLTMEEILREWRIDAELVTLSACQTAAGRLLIGEGYVGFAHAFFRAGARNVLVSLWPVLDKTTELLMVRFYHNMINKGMPKAAALREAKHWLREQKDKSGSSLRHPYFWSAFILIGGKE